MSVCVERTTAADQRRKLYCGALARPLQATSNRVVIRLWTVSAHRMPRFTLVVTVFTHGTRTTQARRQEMKWGVFGEKSGKWGVFL